MGMHAVFCSLSEKRLAQLQREPEVLVEVLEARKETKIPGLLDLGKAWHALDIIVSGEGSDPVLGDALVGRKGKKLRASSAYGSARLLDLERVQRVAKALATLPANIVRDRYPDLYGKNVHGNYGQEKSAPDDVKFLREQVQKQRETETAELEAKLGELRALYEQAAAAGHSMLVVLT